MGRGGEVGEIRRRASGVDLGLLTSDFGLSALRSQRSNLTGECRPRRGHPQRLHIEFRELTTDGRRPLLRRHFQNQIAADQDEDQVGRPGGQGRGELAEVAHGLEQARHDRVEDCNSDGDGDSGDGAFFSGRK